VREACDREPHLVVGEVAEREVAQAGVLVVADVVFDARAAAVVALVRGDRAGLVGEDRLEAMPVVVGEGQLRAGVRALAADDHPRAWRPAGQVQVVGDLTDLPVGARVSVLVRGADPVVLGDLKDRGADGLGQVITDRERDVAVMAPVDQLVAGASGSSSSGWALRSGRTPRSRRMPVRTAVTAAESHGLGSSCARCAAAIAAARLAIVTGRNSRSASAARNAATVSGAAGIGRILRATHQSANTRQSRS
jgi:hypothetical protein